MKVKVTQSCLTLQLHGLYSPWNSPGQNTGVSSHSLLQGTFPTQGSNPGLPHCRRILYQLSHKGSPRGNKPISLYLHINIYMCVCGVYVVCVCMCVCVCARVCVLCLVTQSCLTLSHPMGYSLSGSSVYGISQARML